MTTEDRRPNRAHGAIDHLPSEVQLEIKDLYLERLTYQEIADRLCHDGYQINRNQVWRWLSRMRGEMERVERARERAETLVRHLVPEGASVEAASVILAKAICLEALADADVQQVKSIEDLAKVSMSLGRLQTSGVAREKWEQDKRKRIEEAISQVKGEVGKILEGFPDLTSQLLDVIDRAQTVMTERTA